MQFRYFVLLKCFFFRFIVVVFFCMVKDVIDLDIVSLVVDNKENLVVVFLIMFLLEVKCIFIVCVFFLNLRYSKVY